MLRWSVGEVTVVRVAASDFAIPSQDEVPGWAIPGLAPGAGERFLAFSAFGIVDGDRLIVVDPWLADDSPRSRPDAPAVVEGLLAELAEAGLPADDVDVVVNTHIDGIGWNTKPGRSGNGDSAWVPTFPNARYLVPRAELDAVERAEPLLVAAAELAPLFAAGLVDPVDADEGPVAVSPHVTLRAAPGHNFGHVAVEVDAGGELAIIPGHLFLDLFTVADPSWRPGDGPEAPATRHDILGRLAERHGLLLSPFFGGAGGGRVEGEGTDDTHDTGYRLVRQGS
jgi:hypothetical protein